MDTPETQEAITRWHQLMKNKSGQLDRPTPETDAFSVKFKSVCGSKSWVPTDICRRFERERDEAREAFVIATDQAVQAQCKARNEG